MKTSVRRRLRRGVVILSTLLIVTTALTWLERRRIRSTVTTPAPTADAGPLDAASLIGDVEKLASPEFQGRRTGTAGSKAAQELIVQRFRAIGAQPAFPSGFSQRFSFTHHSIKGLLSPSRPYETHYPEAINLGAVIRGTTNPERFIALTAHYDGFGIRDGQFFPGADDNASGVAVMLGVARVLAERRLAHSILLLAFDAEEIGIRGARHFVKNPPVDLSLVDVVVNLDMVGRSHDNLLVAAGTSYYPDFEEPVRAAAATRGISVMFGHDRPIYKAGLVDDWTGSSDHAPFHDAGVPFVYLGVEDHADYHQPSDTAAKIDAKFLGEVANLVVDLLSRLDAMPPRVRQP